MKIRKVTAPAGSTEEKIAFSPHFPMQVLVRGFTLGHMCRNKIQALLDRREIRDAFDLEYMIRKEVLLELSEAKRERIVATLKGFKTFFDKSKAYSRRLALTLHCVSKMRPSGSNSWNRRSSASPTFVSKKRLNERVKGITVWATARQDLTLFQKCHCPITHSDVLDPALPGGHG